MRNMTYNSYVSYSLSLLLQEARNVQYEALNADNFFYHYSFMLCGSLLFPLRTYISRSLLQLSYSKILNSRFPSSLIAPYSMCKYHCTCELYCGVG